MISVAGVDIVREDELGLFVLFFLLYVVRRELGDGELVFWLCRMGEWRRGGGENKEHIYIYARAHPHLLAHVHAIVTCAGGCWREREGWQIGQSLG